MADPEQKPETSEQLPATPYDLDDDPGGSDGTSRQRVPAVFAFILGITAFVSLVVISFAKNLRSVFTVGWWILLAIYIVAAVSAAIRS